jgi:hypothetical protein
LFDTTTLPPPKSKIQVMWTHWDREATYGFTNHWDDTMSRGVLEKGAADVRVSVYRYDQQQMQRLCRSTSDPKALTNVIHRLPEPIPADEAMPLTLPPGRETLEAIERKFGFKRLPTDPLYWPLSWTAEAMIETLKDSITAPGNAIRVLAVFSEGGVRGGSGPTPSLGGSGPTTTTAQDVADWANALGVAVYPVVLDLEEYLHHPFAISLPDGAPHHSTTGLNLSAIQMVVGFVGVGELTGGRAFYPSRIDAVVVNDILDVIRNQGLSQYLAGFAPPPSGRQRKHNLEIRLKSKSSGKLMGGKRTAVY